MRTARALVLLVGMALVLLTACSAPSLNLAPTAPTDTRLVVTFTTPNGKGGLTGGLEALDVTTGQLLWKTQLGNIIDGHPTIANGVVYARTLAHFFAVRESDGKLLWRTPPVGTCSGGPIEVDQSAITVISASGVQTVLDPATGAERWHLANPVRACVMRHGVIYAIAELMGDASDLIPQAPRTPAPTIDFRQHPPVGAALVALNERDGSLLWQVRNDVAFVPGAVNDRTLYGWSLGGNTFGNTYAFDAHSGRQVTASSHPAEGATGWTTYATGLFIAATDRFVLLYDSQTDPIHPRTRALSASDGKVLWEEPGDIFHSSADGPFNLGVLINGDFIYHGGGDSVTAFRVSDGSVAWTWSFEAVCFTSSLRVIGGLVFATSATAIVSAPCPRSSLVSLDVATGTVNWQHDLDGIGAGYLAAPAQ